MQNNQSLSLKELKRNPQLIGEPDYQSIIKDLTCDPSDGGWKSQKDGQIAKFKDSSIKLYTKKDDNDPIQYVRFDSYLPNVTNDKLAIMMNNVNIRAAWDDKAKNDINHGKVGSNSEIIQQFLPFPFPLTNRDYVNRRYIFSNKEHPDFFKKYDLPREAPAYLIVYQPVDLTDLPAKKSPVRARVIMNVLSYSDPKNPKNTIVKAIIKANMNGNVPDFAVNMVAVKTPIELNENILKCYPNLDKNGSLDRKLTAFS